MHLFPTFFLGGFECADLINNRGTRVDLLRDTHHDQRVEEDYRLLVSLGIRTVREGIQWSVVEKEPYNYDFSEVQYRILVAEKHGIQQVWDVCHFGYPEGLMPSHPQFAARFAAVCTAFTRLYKSVSQQPLVVVPINEISFISWLGGDARGTIPFAIRTGFDVKYFLCRAAILGVRAIKEVDPEAQILFVEPLVRIHPKEGEGPCMEIKQANEIQFQAMDIIMGRMCPELGGESACMDLVGFNYYYNNQWENGGETIGWCTARRRISFPDLLQAAANRYSKPVLLSETGHFGEHRPQWMEQITADCISAIERGVDLKGICIYPVLDRPDWDTGSIIDCGIWAYDKNGHRKVQAEYAQVVQRCTAQMNQFFHDRIHKQKVEVSTRSLAAEQQYFGIS